MATNPSTDFFRSRKTMRSLFTPIFCLCALRLAALGADSANITFSLDFPNSDPEHYSISVDSDGRTKYESRTRISPDSEDRESYETEFHFSPANRARLFDLAAQAHYFSGKIDSGNRKIAFTGTKKLTYHDGTRANTAEYDYTTVAPVQQITALFQSVAATMEFGRRLAHHYRYQKLALNGELKRLEAQLQDNQLGELQALELTLREIVNDNSVINVDRARAQRLIDLGRKEEVQRH